MMDAEAVLAAVAAAFPSEAVPARDVLLNRHCCECIEVSEAFGYKPWPAITLDDLRAGGETALLTAAAWRYYLPAVITWCVRSPEAVGVIQDNLVFQLEPPEPAAEAARHQWFRERAEGFSEPQRRAVLGYLDWYRERQEAEYRALKAELPEHVYRAVDYWRTESGFN
jgi:hypothetical protein